MNQTKYSTGQPVNLFDAILAQLDKEQIPGIVLGFASDSHVNVALFGGRYCESDGRKEATELGRNAQFFRADNGIVCLETTELTLEISKLTLTVPWGGPATGKRGVTDAPSIAVCSPEPLTKTAGFPQTAGAVSASS